MYVCDVSKSTHLALVPTCQTATAMKMCTLYTCERTPDAEMDAGGHLADLPYIQWSMDTQVLKLSCAQLFAVIILSTRQTCCMENRRPFNVLRWLMMNKITHEKAGQSEN